MAPVELLVVNGDSNTYGSEHAEPERTTWAAVLGAHLGVPVVNLAAPGGSNQRLVRTTVEHLPEVVRRRSLPPERVLYVPMWSLPNRREHWASGPHRWATTGEQLDDGNWRHIGAWGVRGGDPAAVAWYRHLQDDGRDVEELLVANVLLTSWLRDFGCRFVVTSAFDVLTDEDLRTGRAQVELLDEGDYLGGLDGLVRRSFHRLVIHLHDRGPNGHKLAASHRHYAEEHLLAHVERMAVGARGR